MAPRGKVGAPGVPKLVTANDGFFPRHHFAATAISWLGFTWSLLGRPGEGRVTLIPHISLGWALGADPLDMIYRTVKQNTDSRDLTRRGPEGRRI